MTIVATNVLMAPFAAIAICAVSPVPMPHSSPVSRSGQSRVAAPFIEQTKISYSNDELKTISMREHYVSPSSSSTNIIVVRIDDASEVEALISQPDSLVHEFKRLSGLTWGQVADIFGVSSRTPFNWANGEKVTSEHHQALGDAVATLREIDRGTGEENRKLLLGESDGGVTLFSFLKDGNFVKVRALAGQGKGRPTFARSLTQEARMINGPDSFKDMLEAEVGDNTEIEIISSATPRKARIRRKKA